MSRNSKKDDYLRKREEGFNLNSLDSVKMREYDALRDPNMRHYFENKPIQYFLYRTGQIDQHGRVIDLQKNKSKLFILEREFHEAEKIEEKRQKEEMEMRVSNLLVTLDLFDSIVLSLIFSIASKANALTR